MTEQTLEPLRIMVVDDEVEVGRMIVRMLKSESYAPEFFDNARDALQAARDRDYGLIITDIVMPGPADDPGSRLQSRDRVRCGLDRDRWLRSVRLRSGVGQRRGREASALARARDGHRARVVS